jgi:hypothetical protein
MLKPGYVQVHLDSATFGGYYLAQLWRVQSKLTGATHRKLVRDCIDSWPELTHTVEQRKELRRFPLFVLALILVQE